MKRLLTAIFLASVLALPASMAFAQDGGTEVSVVVPNPDLDADPSIGEVISEVTDVIADAGDLKTGKFLAIAAFLAGLFKLLLSLLKLTSNFFKNKTVPKIAALVLGLATYLFANLALGVGWVDALILAGSGPGAILFHEISKLIPALRAIKDAESEESTS